MENINTFFIKYFERLRLAFFLFRAILKICGKFVNYVTKREREE